MGILYSLLIIALGVIALEKILTEKFPASSPYIAKLCRYKDGIGLTGLVVGLLSFIVWLIVLHYFTAPPLRILIGMVSIIILIMLGLVYGINSIRSNVSKPEAKFMVNLEKVRAQILPYQEKLGVAAIVVGIAYLVINL